MEEDVSGIGGVLLKCTGCGAGLFALHPDSGFAYSRNGKFLIRSNGRDRQCLCSNCGGSSLLPLCGICSLFGFDTPSEIHQPVLAGAELVLDRIGDFCIFHEWFRENDCQRRLGYKEFIAEKKRNADGTRPEPLAEQIMMLCQPGWADLSAAARAFLKRLRHPRYRSPGRVGRGWLWIERERRSAEVNSV